MTLVTLGEVWAGSCTGVVGGVRPPRHISEYSLSDSAAPVGRAASVPSQARAIVPGMPRRRSSDVLHITPNHSEEGATPPDAKLASLAARQHGVVTAAQLRLCGLGDSAIGHRAEAGRLHRVHRGVYAVGHASLSLHGRSLVSDRALREVLTRATGRRGTPHLAGLIEPGPLATRSELEDRFLDFLRAHGLPRPAVNAPLTGLARPAVADFLFAAAGLVVETDGARYHGHRLARQSDAARQAMLEAAGYRVLRLTWAQVTRRGDETVRRLRNALGPGELSAS